MSNPPSVSVLAALLAVVATLVAAALLTGLARRYAIKKSLVDIPNERSSHRVPTVRGGGVSIVVCALLGALALWGFGLLSASFAMAWSGGLLVAWIGWRDDHGHVSPAWRALCHFVAATWAVAWLGGTPTLVVGEMTIDLGWAGSLLSIIGVVWLINLFNFMDGIDGIAGAEAAFVAAAGGTFLWLSGTTGLALLSFLLAAASGGFLFWNWPPAKIFMGDVGSGALGFFVALLALAGEKVSAVPVAVWIILCGVFVCDATFTLLRRVVNGERWYSAHRSHAYQRLVQLGRSHLHVTVAVLLSNITVLFPMALAGWSARGLLIWMVLLMCLSGFTAWLAVQRQFDLQQKLSRP